MAFTNVDAWIPEEWESPVTMRVLQMSAVEREADRIPMNSQTKYVPRTFGMGIDLTGKGSAYNEDATTNDGVLLTAFKFTRAVRITDEDMTDSLSNIIAAKQGEWATSYAKALDNATLAVTAAASGAPAANKPFNSVYYSLTQSNAATSYTANANITPTTSAGPTYAGLNAAAKLLENSDFYDPTQCVVIAHPSFRGSLRGILDDQHRPIFIEYNNADIPTTATLFGLPIRWSAGAKTSATFTPTPGGNPLLIFCHPGYLKLGIRSGPETAFAPADSGPGFLTDDNLLKMRARRGFGVANENAFSVYVNTTVL